MLLTPFPCHKLSHLVGPPTHSSVTYFMDGPKRKKLNLLTNSRKILNYTMIDLPQASDIHHTDLNFDKRNAALYSSTGIRKGISRVCAHIAQGLNFPRAHCYNTQCTAAVAAMPGLLPVAVVMGGNHWKR